MIRVRLKSKRFLAVLVWLLLTGSGLTAESPLDLYRMGVDALDDGQYYSALDYFKQSLRINSSYVDALFGLSETYFLLQEYDEALEFSEQALKGSARRIDILNLQGRIYLGLGDLQRAEDLFRQVLQMEPNNMDASYGRAEIAVFRGNYKEGTDLFERSLSVIPDSRRALLSLVVLLGQQGERNKAELYLNKALKKFPQDRMVLDEAIKFYSETENWDQAETLALQLDTLFPGSQSTALILGKIYNNTGQYEKAAEYFQESIRLDQENPLIWYYLGQSYSAMGNFHEALICYKTVRIIDPHDEMTRITAENLLMKNYSLNHEERRRAAAYHFSQGDLYKGKYLYEKALQEYRRGRLLAPLDLDGWWKYASILNALGQTNRYRDELKALKKEQYSDPEFLRLYELVMSTEDLSLLKEWDTAVVNRDCTVSLDFYVDGQASSFYHAGASLDMISYLGDILMGNPRFALGDLRKIASPADAYKNSRRSGSDFYLVFGISEMERSIQLRCDLCLSRTGTVIHSFSLLRSGNLRVEEILQAAAAAIVREIPLKGYLKGVDEDQVLISLGDLNQVTEEMTLILLRQGTGRWLDQPPYRDYIPEDLLGVITIDAVQENLSRGTLKRNSPFDMVNPGDEVYMLSEDSSLPDTLPETISEELKSQLLRLY